jgi:hypothetical protein
MLTLIASVGRQHFVDTSSDIGIEHVYDSRSPKFAVLIGRGTARYGVDIVLNSFTRSAQRAGLELLGLGWNGSEVVEHSAPAHRRWVAADAAEHTMSCCWPSAEASV